MSGCQFEDDLTEEEKHFEEIGAKASDIVLKTTHETCKYCMIGKVKKVARPDERDNKFLIYTRNGTINATQEEYRCNNNSRVKKCRAGHYYGYTIEHDVKHYEDDALKNDFLVTSNQTAFSVDYLFDSVLQILCSNTNFESLAKIYNNLHFVNLPTDLMQRRIEAQRKRIASAISTYGYLEVGQRYGINPFIYKGQGGLNKLILENKEFFRDKFRENWSHHECDVKGCDSVLTIDGGCKPSRMLCDAKCNGVREYTKSGFAVAIGCTQAPNGTKERFCLDHKSLETPVLPAESVSHESRSKLRDHRKSTADSSEASQVT